MVQLNPEYEKYIKDGVKFVGNSTALRWQITAGWKKKSDGSPALKNGKKQMIIIGEVHCPCNDAGVHGATPFAECLFFTCDDFPCVCARARALCVVCCGLCVRKDLCEVKC